jgi:hypothetical protein
MTTKSQNPATTSSETGLAFERRGAGVPIVLLPGLTFERRTWRPIVERLGDDVCSVAVDLPAQGDSRLPDRSRRRRDVRARHGRGQRWVGDDRGRNRRAEPCAPGARGSASACAGRGPRWISRPPSPTRSAWAARGRHAPTTSPASSTSRPSPPTRARLSAPSSPTRPPGAPVPPILPPQNHLGLESHRHRPRLCCAGPLVALLLGSAPAAYCWGSGAPMSRQPRLVASFASSSAALSCMTRRATCSGRLSASNSPSSSAGSNIG